MLLDYDAVYQRSLYEGGKLLPGRRVNRQASSDSREPRTKQQKKKLWIAIRNAQNEILLTYYQCTQPLHHDFYLDPLIILFPSLPQLLSLRCLWDFLPRDAEDPDFKLTVFE